MIEMAFVKEVLVEIGPFRRIVTYNENVNLGNVVEGLRKLILSLIKEDPIISKVLWPQEIIIQKYDPAYEEYIDMNEEHKLFDGMKLKVTMIDLEQVTEKQQTKPVIESGHQNPLFQRREEIPKVEQIHSTRNFGQRSRSPSGRTSVPDPPRFDDYKRFTKHDGRQETLRAQDKYGEKQEKLRDRSPQRKSAYSRRSPSPTPSRSRGGLLSMEEMAARPSERQVDLETILSGNTIALAELLAGKLSKNVAKDVPDPPEKRKGKLLNLEELVSGRGNALQELSASASGHSPGFSDLYHRRLEPSVRGVADDDRQSSHSYTRGRDEGRLSRREEADGDEHNDMLLHRRLTEYLMDAGDRHHRPEERRSPSIAHESDREENRRLLDNILKSREEMQRLEERLKERERALMRGDGRFYHQTDQGYQPERLPERRYW